MSIWVEIVGVALLWFIVGFAVGGMKMKSKLRKEIVTYEDLVSAESRVLIVEEKLAEALGNVNQIEDMK
jgi:hypothetical protein